MKRDKFTSRAKSEGYKARSVFKLKSLNNRFKLIKEGNRILDLGAWPGSWSQYCLELKTDVDDANSYIEFGIARVADSLFNSMRMNAMNNKSLFDEMYFEYGPLVIHRNEEEYDFGINISSLYDTYRANSTSGNKFDLKGTLFMGIPTYTRKEGGTTESGVAYKGRTYSYGGAIAYKVYPDGRLGHLKHEMIHVLQEDELFGVSRNVGLNYNPEFFGVKLYGLENLKSKLLFKKPFEWIAELQKLDSYESHYSDLYWWEREAHGFMD